MKLNVYFCNQYIFTQQTKMTKKVFLVMGFVLMAINI